MSRPRLKGFSGYLLRTLSTYEIFRLSNGSHACDDLSTFIYPLQPRSQVFSGPPCSNQSTVTEISPLFFEVRRRWICLGHERPPHYYPTTKAIVLKSSQVSWRLTGKVASRLFWQLSRLCKVMSSVPKNHRRTNIWRNSRNRYVHGIDEHVPHTETFAKSHKHGPRQTQCCHRRRLPPKPSSLPPRH